MSITDEQIIEISCLEPVSIHGLFGVLDLDGTFLMVFFRWRIKSEDGVLIREKVPVHVVELPRGVAEPGSVIDGWLKARPAGDDIPTALH
jgi:hypothetical protein